MIKPHLPDLEADPLRFTEVVLGQEWIKDTPTQTFIIGFLTKERPQLPDSLFGLGPHNWLQKFAQTGMLVLSRAPVSKIRHAHGLLPEARGNHRDNEQSKRAN